MTNWKNRRDEDNEVEEVDANEHSYLLFYAGGELYGTKITDVREVIAPHAPKPVADTQPWVKGIINLRGEVLVAVDLRYRLKTSQPPSKSYMVIESEKGSIALMVDSIHAVRHYVAAEIHDRTHLQVNVKNDHFVGVGKQGAETAILLDLKKVFTEEELVQSVGF